VLDADDLAVFRAQTSAATATEDTGLLSVRLPCRPHRCDRALRCAPPPRLRAAGKAGQKWRELDFYREILRISADFGFPIPFVAKQLGCAIRTRAAVRRDEGAWIEDGGVRAGGTG